MESNAIEILEPLGESRSSKLTLDDVESIIIERNNIRTRVIPTYRIDPILCGRDTVMYLVNYDNGWDVISGDLRTDPILIFCDEGSITEEELYSNPAQEAVMKGLTQYLDSLVNNPVKILDNSHSKGNPTPPYSYFDASGVLWVYDGRFLAYSTNQTQSPLCGLKWGQGSDDHSSEPTQKWNITMPFKSSILSSRCFAGCGPVACAQVLYYLHQKNGVPSSFYKNSLCYAYLQNAADSLIISNSNTGFSAYGDHWDLLPIDGVSASTDAFRAASSLMLKIGELTGAVYKYSSTSSNISSFLDAFSYYGYSATYVSNYNESVFRNQIYLEKLPIILRIQGIRSSGTPPSTSILKHFVIAEGYRKLEEHYTYAYRSGESGAFVYHYVPYTFTYEYVAINWGYDGDGEYNSSGGVIWYNINNTLTRSFLEGYDTGTITHMMYDFNCD